MEHYWSAELCHTDHSVQAPLFLLKKHFCCNAEISPCIRKVYFLQLYLALLDYGNINQRGNEKGVLGDYICGSDA